MGKNRQGVEQRWYVCLLVRILRLYTRATVRGRVSAQPLYRSRFRGVGCRAFSSSYLVIRCINHDYEFLLFFIRTSPIIFVLRIFTLYFAVNQVKSDWKKIRDCHRDAVKRRRLLSNIKDPSTIKKWKYEDHMEFLLDFMTTRRREPYFENNVASTSDNDNEDFVVLTETTLENHSTNSETDYVSLSLPKLNQNSSCLPKFSHLSKQHNDSLSEDALDFFFNSMCATTKRLPLKYQLQIKKEIFEIVTRNEETAFQCDNSS